MDQGIIQTLKLKYRKRQLRHMAAEIENHPTKTGSEILKSISVLDAIYWINSSWNEVDDTTIIKCFNKAGFSDNIFSDSECDPCVSTAPTTPDCDTNDDDDDDDDDLPLAVLKLSKEIFDCDFKELASLDCNLATCNTEEINWDLPITELLDSIDSMNNDDGDDDDDDDDSDEAVQMTDICSKSEVMQCITKLKTYSIHNSFSDMLNCIMDLDSITSKTLLTSAKQSQITDFFKA